MDAIFKRKIEPLVVRLLEDLEGKKSNERKSFKNIEEVLNVGIRTLFDVRIPMRDKTTFSADIYLQKKEDSNPTILIRTPYNKALADETKHGTRDVEFFTRNGLVVVMQDVRGRGGSDGEWIPMFNEGLDGYDTVEWIAKQDWCNGKVAMMGGVPIEVGFSGLLLVRYHPI